MIPLHHSALLTRSMLPQRGVLRSVFFWASNQFNTASNTWSSLWAGAQSAMCISTRTHLPATCTFFSTLWSPSTMAGSQPSALSVAPIVSPSRMDHTTSMLRQVVMQLSTSAMVLSHPFWYSNWKLNFTGAATHH